MEHELYDDVLEEEPEDNMDSKEYKYWEKRLHNSLGWVEPEIRAEFLYEKGRNNKIKILSSPLEEKIYWDVKTEEGGGFTCVDQEHSEILSLVLQINERLKRIEKEVQSK